MPSLGYYRRIILFQIVLDFPHLRITSGGWARGSRTTLTRKINDTLPRLPHHVFQCCLLSGLLNGRVTGAWTEKRATMPSHRAGFAPSTTGFLTLHLSEGLPPKIAVPTFVPVSTPRRATTQRAGALTTARVESGSGAFFRATTRASRSGEASRASVPRSMLGWLLGGRATKEERRTAAIRCATRDSALKQCVVANSKETCDRLAQDLDLCKVRSVGNVRCRYRTRARARARPTRASRRRRRVAPAGVPFLGTPSFSKAPPPSCQLRDLVPTARSSKLAVFPPRDSTGTGGLSRRGRRVLPLRAPRRQPHRQGGRRPRLLETAEEDARVHSAKAGLTRS